MKFVICLVLICVLLVQASKIERNLQVVDVRQRGDRGEGHGTGEMDSIPDRDRNHTLYDSTRDNTDNVQPDQHHPEDRPRVHHRQEAPPRPDNADAFMNHTDNANLRDQDPNWPGPNGNETYLNRNNETDPNWPNRPLRNESFDNRSDEEKPIGPDPQGEPKQQPQQIPNSLPEPQQNPATRPEPRPEGGNRRARREEVRERERDSIPDSTTMGTHVRNQSDTRPYGERKAHRQEHREQDEIGPAGREENESKGNRGTTQRTELPYIVTCVAVEECTAAFPNARREITCNIDAGVCVFAS